jgi:hypothetical protein
MAATTRYMQILGNAEAAGVPGHAIAAAVAPPPDGATSRAVRAAAVHVGLVAVLAMVGALSSGHGSLGLHTSLAQSLLSLQVWPKAQLGHLRPPQSMSVSFPSTT